MSDNEVRSPQDPADMEAEAPPPPPAPPTPHAGGIEGERAHHSWLGGLLAAIRHLVAVTPAAHNLSDAVDRLAAEHARWGAEISGELHKIAEEEKPPAPPPPPPEAAADHSADDLNAAEAHDLAREQQSESHNDSDQPQF
jgi:hypothetical protein